jgi:hypothetical protein
VKNVGAGAVELLLKERDENGPYTSLEEFCRRQDLHTVNKRVLESLIKCGAFDGLGVREALIDSKRLDAAIAAAQIDQRAASTGQGSLFDVFGGTESVIAAPPPTVAPANAAVSARERALWEKEVLGFQFGINSLEAAAWLANRHPRTAGCAELSGERVVMPLLLGYGGSSAQRGEWFDGRTCTDDRGGGVYRLSRRSLELWRETRSGARRQVIPTGAATARADKAEEWTAAGRRPRLPLPSRAPRRQRL